MIASLPMYERAENRAAHDRFWDAIQTSLGYGPKSLTRHGHSWDIWRAPDLLLSQTCSLPYRAALHEVLDIVATPVHELPCEAGFYYSVLVVRAADRRDTVEAFSGAPVAVNGTDSQSGWAALPPALRSATTVLTGGHASAHAVAEARADIAALDAVTWAMLQRWDEIASTLRVLATTPPTPALPFVTAKGNDVAAIRDALGNAVDGLSATDRDALGIAGLTDISAAAYMALPLPPEACQTVGNP